MASDQDEAYRRRDDVLLTEVRGELALLKQATELGAKATEASIGGLHRGLASLEQKLDQVIAGQVEPAASPAGRAIIERLNEQQKEIADNRRRIDEGESFRSEIRGAVRVIKGAVVVLTGLSAFATIVSIIVALSQHPSPPVP